MFTDISSSITYAQVKSAIPSSQTSVSMLMQAGLILLLWRGLQFDFFVISGWVNKVPSSSSIISDEDSDIEIFFRPEKHTMQFSHKSLFYIIYNSNLLSLVLRLIIYISWRNIMAYLKCQEDMDSWSHDWSSATASLPGQSHDDRSNWNWRR